MFYCKLFRCDQNNSTAIYATIQQVRGKNKTAA